MSKHIITAASILDGCIVTHRVAAEKLSDEMLRDGWVEVHREEPPTLRIVLEGGRVARFFSSIPAMHIEVTDLDIVAKPEAAMQALALASKNLYEYHLDRETAADGA